jgi:hypothetical protein
VTRYRLLRLAQARRRLLRLRRASGCLGTSRGSSCGSSSTTSTTPRVRVPWHVARLITRLVAPLVVDYFAYAACPGASARRAARRRLLHLRHASCCVGTSRGLSRDSSSITSPRAGSSSTTSPTLRVRVAPHVARLVARLVTRLVARLVTRLVFDYFTYAAHPVASARRAACRVTRRRLLRLRRASGCLDTSCGSLRDSSRRSSWTTSPTPRVRGASARRVAHLAARRQLLHLRRASGCLGTSRGSSRRSSSTTLPLPRIRVPRHVARLVMRLIVDYSGRRDFLLRPHWLYFSHAVRRNYLSRGNTSSTSSMPGAAATSSSGRIASTIHLD